jgi:hypothetical protein
MEMGCLMHAWAWLLMHAWALGYSDFHNLMGFASKKMPNNIL